MPRRRPYRTTGSSSYSCLLTPFNGGSAGPNGHSGTLELSGNLAITGDGLQLASSSLILSGVSKIIKPEVNEALVLSNSTVRITNGGLDVETTGSIPAIATSGGAAASVFEVSGANNTVLATGGPALALDGPNLSVDLTFENLTSIDSSSYGLSFSEVAGSVIVTDTTTIHTPRDGSIYNVDSPDLVFDPGTLNVFCPASLRVLGPLIGCGGPA